MKLCSDTILFSPAPGYWVAYNVRCRTALGFDANGMVVLGKVGQPEEEMLRSNLGEEVLSVWEINRFSNADGLLADPTRVIQDVVAWPPPKLVEYQKFIELLIRLSIITEDEEKYLARFQSKTSMIDYSNFGNFHQQLGQHLMLEARLNPASWWVDQKFSIPGKEIRDNLYSAIQDNFLKNYLKEIIEPDMRVLDLGCGPGYFSNMMSSYGANVIGVDPSESYLAIARENAVGNIRFEKANIGIEGGLNFLIDEKFDLIFMSDALLFYFVPETPNQEANICSLFSDVRRLLKDGGKFVSVEPHYLFWLAPWFGSPQRPFTIFSEYNDPPGMRVTPTLSHLISTFCDNGFYIAGMKEMYPNETFSEKDKRAYEFGRRFPLWQLYELTKKPGQ
ncbi:MAG: methyltransferase domain-containing protein [Burkholderiales bacterium]|nr:methyltransferase domain-containing protein [Burkholderiales bacterium]